MDFPYPILIQNFELVTLTSCSHQLFSLKNNNQVLPLKKTAKIALIGPLGNNKRNMAGTWSVASKHEHSVTLLQGLKNVAGDKGSRKKATSGD